MAKTALITGATSGIGAACARKFAGAGYRVIITGHREGQLAVMAGELEKLDLPEPDRLEARQRMEAQTRNAREWRDILNTFFHRFSGVPDAQGRKIYD